MQRAAAFLLLQLIAVTASTTPIEAAMKEVERVRGLRFSKPVEVEVVPRSELRSVLEAQIARENPIPLIDHMKVLEALQLVDDGEKAVGQLMDVYEAQVLAFYDPSTGKYFTFDRAPDGNPLAAAMEEAVAIHELTHALQDQRFEAGTAVRELEKNWDAQMAYHAVIEGEATLVMLAAMMERVGISIEDLAGNRELVESMSTLAGSSAAFPADAPAYFVEMLQFPYLKGLELVMESFRRDGWDGVSRLHVNKPQSTDEVLEPARYFERVASSKTLPCSDDGSVLSTTLGRFHWDFLLDEKAARGWKGDCVRAIRKGGKLEIRGTSEWLSAADAREFASALEALFEEEKIEGSARRRGSNVTFSWRDAGPRPQP
ncbi:MAG TPA: hypothetical protein VM557_00600 [Thermoanaerobaculia bacterium]|nr:hypothetical protein [Thermoanaerobaculia bacterium]